MKTIVLTAFFLLELIAMFAFGYWGYHIAGTVKIIIAIVVPVCVMVIWGMVLAPKASYAVFSYPTRTGLKLVVFALAAAALYTSGQHAYGIAFLILSILIIVTVFINDWHKI
ncbi:YrdB family protein [Paenibacillus sp. CCS19]|uniref:YrdB family protein n=1 Tax=Paenibacillus sp. CCS19 TaxID=3158387 RepID=UPI00295F5B05|nr:YrdB family protein [Paenibacillus cellulosilyticus]